MNDQRFSEELRRQYEVLTEGAGWCDLGHRTQIALTGDDRARFLNNLCTADIARLLPGQGCEAFVTSVQGKTLGFAYVFCGEQSLVVETVPDQAPQLVAHLDRYLIREDVQLLDRSQSWHELLLSGAQTHRRLGALPVPEPPPPLGHVEVRLGEASVSLRRVNITGESSFLLSADANQIDVARQALRDAGFLECERDPVEAVRVERGWPVFGQDVTDGNLPQEVNRDNRAISFTKGCYLGQETVARIDALGHVNRKLTGVRFFGADLPPIGTRLTVADQEVGQLTSCVFSPRLDSSLAMAYVRRGHDAPGTRLASDVGEAEVVSLPV